MKLNTQTAIQKPLFRELSDRGVMNSYSKSLLLVNALISFSKFDHIVCILYFHHELDFATQLFIII